MPRAAADRSRSGSWAAEGNPQRRHSATFGPSGRSLTCSDLSSLSDFFYDRGWDFAGDLLGNQSDWFGGMIDQYGVFGAFGLLFVDEGGIPILLPGESW